MKMSQHIASAAMIATTCAALWISSVNATEIEVSLTGAQEVPAVETAAEGSGVIVVGEDRTISGSIYTTGMDGIAAHIHVASVHKNGPPIITLLHDGLVHDGDSWVVPDGTILTEEQYQHFLDGDLYINVHSQAFKSGEIRAQLSP